MVVNCTPNIRFQIGGKNENNNNRIRIPILDDPWDSRPLFIILRDSTILKDIDVFLRNNKTVLIHCQL